MKKLLTFSIAWRLWLVIPVILAGMYLPFRADADFTRLSYYTEQVGALKHPAVYSWANFDGIHYLGIASRGYIDEGRFMPFFPFLIRIFSAPFGLLVPITAYSQIPFWVGVVLSSLFFFGALLLLYKLLLLDFPKQRAQNTLLLLLLFPTAFFFAAVYSEGLFLLLCVAVLYFARKRSWFWASVATMFLAVTRLSGILLVIPLLYEYFSLEIQGKKYNWRDHLQALSFGCIPVLLALYSYYNLQTWGDPLYFVHAHGALGNSREVAGLVFPLVTVYRYLKIFITVSLYQFEFWVALLEFTTLGWAVWGVYLSWKQKIRVSYLLFAVSMLFLPLFSGTLSGFPRYVLPVFPLFLSFSGFFEKRARVWKYLFGSLLIVQVLLLILFSRGYYIA